MSKGDMSANGSSEFVRKLYNMLEDPSYEHVVRWGNDGESFVVLEGEKFTKSILPKHFKHSNFASFVRQLNKYDFHKVRQINEENGQSQYGEGAWEFKHPEFQANKKDSLDNIKRKAPAPRKSTQPIDESLPLQQMDLVNTQLVATQQQLEHLQQRYDVLCNDQKLLLDEVLMMQRVIKNHDDVMKGVTGFLRALDEQRRMAGQQFNGGDNSGMGMTGVVGAGSSDQPSTPLQEALQLLGQFPAENLISKELEQRVRGYSFANDYTTPPQDPPNMATGSGVSNMGVGYDSSEFDLVYPIGRTHGIDPINSEHINNIPYSMPPNGAMVSESGGEGTLSNVDRKKNSTDPGWGIQKPRVLLVEDDKTCARIGCKLLQMFECGVETARNGLEAVNIMNNNPVGFDLILMDIIMPMLDGVSATSCIRDINTAIPIIAMTSNIRQDDIEIYFRYGMNGLLPKPFTKDGLLKILGRHLAPFKKDYQSPIQQTHHPDSYAPLNLNMQNPAQPFKDEPSPGKSPSWHSPNQISGSSPVGTGTQNAYMQQMQQGQPVQQGSGQYTIAPTHAQVGYQTQSSPTAISAQGPGSVGGPGAGQGQGQARSGVSGPQRRGMNEIGSNIEDQKPDKRQRTYPPQGGFS